MKISTGQKFLKKVCEIRFIQLWIFMLSWVEHEKSFISTGPVFTILSQYENKVMKYKQLDTAKDSLLKNAR